MSSARLLRVSVLASLCITATLFISIPLLDMFWPEALGWFGRMGMLWILFTSPFLALVLLAVSGGMPVLSTCPNCGGLISWLTVRVTSRDTSNPRLLYVEKEHHCLQCDSKVVWHETDTDTSYL